MFKSVYGFKEKSLKILQALLQNPKRSDREIAKDVGISQPTVSRTRNRFEQEKIITNYIALPDFSKLGFELMSFTVVKHNPTILQKLKENNEILTILDNADQNSMLVISIHKDYTSYHKTFSTSSVISSCILLTKLVPLKKFNLERLIQQQTRAELNG